MVNNDALIYSEMDDAGKEQDRKISIMEDFLEWFWDNIVSRIQFKQSHLQRKETAGPYVSE